MPQLIGTLMEGAVLGDVACFNYRPLHQIKAEILKVTSSNFQRVLPVLQCLTSQMLSSILFPDRKKVCGDARWAWFVAFSHLFSKGLLLARHGPPWCHSESSNGSRCHCHPSLCSLAYARWSLLQLRILGLSELCVLCWRTPENVWKLFWWGLRLWSSILYFQLVQGMYLQIFGV